jgi:hypothetical protein
MVTMANLMHPLYPCQAICFLGSGGGSGLRSTFIVQARQLWAPNPALHSEAWLNDMLAGIDHGQLKAHLLLDVNDPNMIFEICHGHSLDELANASATILPAPSRASLFLVLQCL